MIQVDGIQKDPPVGDASAITSGTLATARLGSGSASSSTYLRGDSTWAAVSGGGVSNESDLPDFALPRYFGPGAIVKMIGSGVTLSSGDNDLGTPPTGKRWALISGSILFMTGGSVTSAYLEFKRSGTYYRTMTSTSGAAPTAAAATNMPILEDTDTLAINVNGTGCVFIGAVIEYSAASSGLKSVVTLSMASGNNTLYTVPANTYAILLGQGTLGSGLLTFTPAKEFITYVNTSGGTRTFYFNAVPSGGSVVAPGAGSNSLHHASTFTVSNNQAATLTVTILGGLGPGDFLNLNTNAATATQIAWVNVYEFAAST